MELQHGRWCSLLQPKIADWFMTSWITKLNVGIFLPSSFSCAFLLKDTNERSGLHMSVFLMNREHCCLGSFFYGALTQQLSRAWLRLTSSFKWMRFVKHGISCTHTEQNMVMLIEIAKPNGSESMLSESRGIVERTMKLETIWTI